MLEFSKQIGIGNARIRIDVRSDKEIKDMLEDIDFISYRLPSVKTYTEIKKVAPDIVWDIDKKQKRMRYDGEKMSMEGEWSDGELQKIVALLLAKELERRKLFAFHASAVRYKGANIVFLSGEENHGKTMSLIETSRRGGKIIACETLVCGKNGQIVMGTKDILPKKRPKGTERIDKPDIMMGVRKFFDSLPESRGFEEGGNVDLVILPDIDGNFDTFIAEMDAFEKEYQTFCCISGYYMMQSLLATGVPMPIIDDEELRQKRAIFVSSFAKRPYYFIRGRSPQIIIDEVERILVKSRFAREG